MMKYKSILTSGDDLTNLDRLSYTNRQLFGYIILEKENVASNDFKTAVGLKLKKNKKVTVMGINENELVFTKSIKYSGHCENLIKLVEGLCAQYTFSTVVIAYNYIN